MKHIILFTGGVETLEFFSVQMAKVWEKRGCRIFWFDLVVSEESAHALMDYYKRYSKDEFYAFTFNFEGIAGEDGLYAKSTGSLKEQWNFWDDTNIKVINMVVDHPLYYHKHLAIHPQRYLQIHIDKNHLRYMRRFFPDVEVIFIPSGGTELNADYMIMDKPYLAMSERPIDVIFTGNYTPKHILRKNLDNMEQDYIDFYENMLDILIKHPDMTIESLAEKMLRGEFPDITDSQLKDCMPNMMYVDLAVRFHYRELAIRSLVDSGIRVHTYGRGYEYIQCEHPENIICHGGVYSQECLDMISQSKISLNVMPWFKDGAHDRIFNTMLNGAVSLTDSSEWLEHVLSDGENVLFYKISELMDYEQSGFDIKKVSSYTDRLKALLKQPQELQKIADRGYELCKGVHSWQERAVMIWEYFVC